MKGLFYICLIWICFRGWSQPVDDVQSIDLSTEKFGVMTDRSIYIAGEVINFRIFNLSPGALRNMDWSKVFYFELVSPDGFSHAHTKFTMDSTGAGGALVIPGDIATGTYFLKGYTRWMRNFGPAIYSYLSVEIVNPIIRNVLPVDTTSTYSLPLFKLEAEPNKTLPILENLSRFYTKRATVKLNLSMIGDIPPASCCVTVVRKGYLNRQWESKPPSKGFIGDRIEQIPETRGISLTGKVVLTGSENPAPLSVVYISVMGEERDFYCNYADSAGRFYFSFPDQYGDKDLFISVSHPDPVELDLYIDQDFCTEPITLPSYSIEIDKNRKQVIADLSLNAQIRDQYYTSQTNSQSAASPPEKYFYGNPSTVIKFDDFIKLPTMEEYFSEVIPQISVRKTSRSRRFRVWGEYPELGFYEPLVMIDGVAIFNVEAVLDISPGYIDRIEIVEAPYIKGNVTFGGIIHMISRNDDMGYIDLPASGLLVNYRMFDENLQGDQIDQPNDPRLPDVRNTLYWNPFIELISGENREISFQSPDMAGDYLVIIRGYNSEGYYFEKSMPFCVE